MTDKEILAELCKADGLLKRYRAIVEPVARELAVRKSRRVFKKDGCYRPHLGCQDSGLSTICLHIEGDALGKTFSSYQRRAENRACDFELRWTRRLMRAGVRNIHVSGHF